LFMRAKATLIKNRWRYLSLLVGFLLFVAPFALLTRAVYYLMGNVAQPTLHTICLRMPIDWIFGAPYRLAGSVMAAFVIVVLVTSIFFGPIFCGWLCPVGAVSEGISRALPIPDRFRLQIRDTKVTVGLRYGFLLGFIAVAVLVGYSIASSQFSSICCRYCASSVLQNLTDALFGNPSAIEYWHSGSILSLVGWLVVGGLFMAGGRGWCLFFCPLGALSSLAHRVGARLGFYRVDFDPKRCLDCKKCSESGPQGICPVWAIKEDRTVERTLCINCKECVNLCQSGAYSFRRGWNGAKQAA